VIEKAYLVSRWHHNTVSEITVSEIEDYRAEKPQAIEHRLYDFRTKG